MSEAPSGSRDSPYPENGSRPAGRRGRAPREFGSDEAPGPDPAVVHNWYTTGMELLEKGSPAAAAQVLQRAANAEPASRSVREALARAQFDTGQYAAAADNFRVIVEASPTDDYAHFGLGLALARTGDHEAAAEYLALAAAMRPDRKHYTDALRQVRATLKFRSFPRGGRPPNVGLGESGTVGLSPCRPIRLAGDKMPETLAEAYDVLLFDLDGVVYIGGIAIPGAPEALQRAKRAGAHVAYVTNNASRTPAAVAALLEGMGAPATEADVVTSAQAAARLLADKLPAKSRVLVIGGTALRLAVRERGLVPVSTATEHPAAVVQGFAPGIGYGLLAEGGLAVSAGALFVATNADSTIPNARGTAPGNGSLLKVIEYATGTAPIVAGKPEPPLHRESVIRTGAQRPLVIGDRLDTDIEAAYNTGTDSLLVLTGVDNPRTVTLAPVHHRPTYIAETLDALLEPYPAVTTTGTGAACGGWAARTNEAGTLALSGTGAAIDGLRALATAAWAAHDKRGALDYAQVAAALNQLAAGGLRIN
jgi:glycerol-1-phosphatase